LKDETTSRPLRTWAAARRDRPAETPSHRVPIQLLLILLIATLVRLLLAADNLAANPDFLAQDLPAVQRALADSSRPFMDSFGFEASNIAHALVCSGEGFASPFGGATGPTAWIAPGVVAVYAASFALWGCFTVEAILFMFAVALAVSWVTTVMVFHIGARLGGDAETGLLAALFFALLPFEAWIFHVSGQLDFNLQIAWFAALLLAVLRAMERRCPQRETELGFVSAAAVLFYPGFVLCTALSLMFVARGRTTREVIRLVAIVTFVHVAVVGPYVGWQSMRLGGFVPVKSNGIFELALGNTFVAEGVLNDDVFSVSHPSQNVVEFQRYQELGELTYVRSAFDAFVDELRWTDFLHATLRRFNAFFVAYEIKAWDQSQRVVAAKSMLWKLPVLALLSLVLMRRGRLARLEVLLLLFTLAYATPYLVTGVMERYRLPMVTTVAVLLALVTAAAGCSFRREPSL
jgi:hypothetical protein